MLNMADNNSFFDLFSAYLKTQPFELKLFSFDGMYIASLNLEIFNFYPCDHGSVNGRRFCLVKGQFSLVWSIVLCMQELYT